MASGIMSAQRALGSTAGFAIMGSVLAAVVGSVLPGKFEPFLAEPARTVAVEAVVDDANPRAVVVADRSRQAAARRGGRSARSWSTRPTTPSPTASGSPSPWAWSCPSLVLILGAVVFPKGRAEEHTEVAEADALASSEAAPPPPS